MSVVVNVVTYFGEKIWIKFFQVIVVWYDSGTMCRSLPLIKIRLCGVIRRLSCSSRCLWKTRPMTNPAQRALALHRSTMLPWSNCPSRTWLSMGRHLRQLGHIIRKNWRRCGTFGVVTSRYHIWQLWVLFLSDQSINRQNGKPSSRSSNRSMIRWIQNVVWLYFNSFTL